MHAISAVVKDRSRLRADMQCRHRHLRHGCRNHQTKDMLVQQCFVAEFCIYAVQVPELNVQNGVLKALSFLFEYIGEMGKDYIYAVSPLLEDALMDRDLVHRQTAASVVQHMSLGVAGLGCEDALTHLLNYVWPNIFETSPHVVQAVQGAVDGCRLALGPAVVLHYTLQGLFHPARKVREVYWKIYNNLYIGAQDALVAFYPRLEDEGPNTYHRHDLDIFV